MNTTHANDSSGCPKTVIIAGGGIGGLALGIALRRHGIEAVVYERAATFGNTGSGIVLAPNGMKAIDHIDPELGAAVRRTGRPDPGDAPSYMLTERGNVLSARPFGDLEGRWGGPLVPIMRADMHRLLVDAAAAAGLPVYHGSAITGFTQDNDTVTACLDDGRRVSGDVLVGADGLRSAIRPGVVGDTPLVYSGMTSVRGVAPTPAAYPNGFLTTGRGAQFFAAAVSDARLYWVATFKAPEAAWTARPPEHVMIELQRVYRGWHAPIAAMLAATDAAELVVTDIHDRDPVQRWSAGRVVLLGDAVHPMTPMMGQGANMALEDAARLADLLAHSADVAPAFETYQRERAPRVAKVVKQSRMIAKMGQLSHPVAVAVRNGMMRMMLRGDADKQNAELFGYSLQQIDAAHCAKT